MFKFAFNITFITLMSDKHFLYFPHLLCNCLPITRPCCITQAGLGLDVAGRRGPGMGSTRNICPILLRLSQILPHKYLEPRQCYINSSFLIKSMNEAWPEMAPGSWLIMFSRCSLVLFKWYHQQWVYVVWFCNHMLMSMHFTQ